MLAVEALHTHYGQAHILRDVSLRVETGEVVGLLGRNGAGKSTTLKTIIGLVKASAGAVRYGGQDLRRLRNDERARLGLGYVPEERRIFRRLSVLENLATGRRPPRDGRPAWTESRVFELFPKLHALRDRMGGQLSGGEQQMLTIGRTLMTNPGCLLLDEPTEGLAPVIVDQVIAALRALKAEGLSVLLSEQNRHTAAALTDRVYVLNKGTLLYDGPLAAMSPATHQALGW